jgi:hypothetical protein
MNLRNLLCCILSILAAAAPLHATVIPVFGGDYVTTTVNPSATVTSFDSVNGGVYSRGVDLDTGTAGLQHFSQTVPLSFAAGSSAPGVYGGAVWWDNAAPAGAGTGSALGTAPMSYRNVSPADALRFYLSADFTSSGTVTPDEGFGVALWAVTIPGGETLSALEFKGSVGRTTDLTRECRWVVQNGASLYVSQASFIITSTSTTITTYTLPDVTATNWAVWNPSASVADLKFNSAAATFAPTTLNDVTTVGFLYSMEDAINSGSDAYTQVTGFTVTTVAGTPMAPVITSPTTASGMVGSAFTYQIAATNSPTSYGVTGTLPGGLTLNTTTGAITGTPTTVESPSVTISATNAAGSGTATLTITVMAPMAPVITSGATASGNVGAAFTYQIAATNSPTSYAVSGTLPDGLSLNTSTGAITGTPTTVESQTVTISATNAGGTGTASLAIDIAASVTPVITSPGTTLQSAGGEFSFQITATNSPTSYAASGLPPGLVLDTTTGLISGTAVTAGTYNVTVSATNAGGTQSANLQITVGTYKPPVPLGGKVSRFYFIGNSLTLSLTTASEPNRARLERLFATRGNRLVFGAQLGAGVNLDQHWMGRLYAAPPNENWMKQTYFDDQNEQSSNDGFAGPAPTFGTSFFRDYTFAFQGKRRDVDGTIVTGNTFDAVILQPYIAYLEPSGYTTTEQTNGARGDRAALNDFIAYASGDNPSGHTVTRKFYIYSAWPQCLGIEQEALDPDSDGVFSFSEFYDASYTPPVNPATAVNARVHVPNRAYLDQLYTVARADNPAVASNIHIIPVGEVMAELDRLIRLGQLPGIEAYYNRNLAYYTAARAGEQITFNFIYPPGQTANWGDAFIAAQGIKNLYCDNIHWNDQTHNTTTSGTLGAYIAATTVYTVLTGENPNLFSASEIAKTYEHLDATADAALIAKIQEVIWNIVTSPNWKGINFAERTGVSALAAEGASYAAFKAARFTADEQADAAISGEHADPDHDGAKNILEFIRQTNPKLADSTPPLTLDGNATEAHVGFKALSHAAGVLPALDVSDDLQTWSRVSQEDLDSAPSATGGFTDYSATFPSPGPRQFYRLALSYLPDTPTLPLVAWGTSNGIVTANQNLVTGKGSASVNLTTPASPSIGGAYSTHSPLFFAAAKALSGNSENAWRVINNANPGDGTGDAILVSFNKDTAATNDGVFTAIWTQDGTGSAHGFLNGANTGNVTLANMRVRVKTTGLNSTSQLRFVIRRGAQFYISEDCGAVTSVFSAIAPGNTTPYEEIALANLAAVAWHPYDPATDMLAFGAPVVLTSFDQITAVGLNWRNYGTDTFRQFYIESFTANFFAP